jgi:hypothetical protein
MGRHVARVSTPELNFGSAEITSPKCHYLMWIAIGYIVVELQRGFSLERVNSPLSLDTSLRWQYVILTYCHLAL